GQRPVVPVRARQAGWHPDPLTAAGSFLSVGQASLLARRHAGKQGCLPYEKSPLLYAASARARAPSPACSSRTNSASRPTPPPPHPLPPAAVLAGVTQAHVAGPARPEMLPRRQQDFMAAEQAGREVTAAEAQVPDRDPEEEAAGRPGRLQFHRLESFKGVMP